MEISLPCNPEQVKIPISLESAPGAPRSKPSEPLIPLKLGLPAAPPLCHHSSENP